MAHAIEAIVQEGRPRLARQLAQEPVDGLEVFEDQVLDFWEGCSASGRLASSVR